MAEPAAMPSPAEVGSWVGTGVAELGGTRVGEVEGFFFDVGTGEPVWLIAKLGRRRGTRMVAVPLSDCAGAAFGVWIAQDGEKLRTAPVVDPSRPLRREHELAICAHFGIGKTVGRAAEAMARPEGEITAEPLK
jgi:hypothetical protein